ncbi:MAG TPA: sialidase family protein [Gemmatimonadales bacterium]|jgi:hypothetical protein|nr:sialidase family protein [Gemmatimonadales bacterium]
MRSDYALIAPALLIALTACMHEDSVRFGAADTLSAPTSVGTAPMVAMSPAGVLASAWVSAPDSGIDGRLYVSTAGGQVAEVQDTLGPIEGHGESPPKLAYGSDGSLDAIYVVVKDVLTARQPLEALRFVRSSDGGKAWSAPVTVTDDAVFGLHNFHALHVAHDGTIYVSWLGGEEGKSTVWITHSTDQGVTWAPRVRVDTGLACDCCRTALASTPDGTLYIAWRHIFPGSVRDIVVAHSSDHGMRWSDPVRVHADDWVVNACPRAGPSLQVDSIGRVHVAWWTGKEKAAGVWYARSTDGGKSFSAPLPLGVADFSRPAHVQLAVGPGDLVAAVWDDGTMAQPRIVIRVSHNGGGAFGTTDPLSGPGRSAAFPVLAVHAHSIVAAWSESSAPPAPAAPMTMPANGAPKHRGIKPIGNGEVVLRHGVLE